MSAELRTTAPTLGRLTAPAAWQTVDLISDLHLQASEPATFEAWRHYMAHTPADAVLLLGDVFEVWVGDDAVAHDAFCKAVPMSCDKPRNVAMWLSCPATAIF